MSGVLHMKILDSRVFEATFTRILPWNFFAILFAPPIKNKEKLLACALLNIVLKNVIQHESFSRIGVVLTS